MTQQDVIAILEGLLQAAVERASAYSELDAGAVPSLPCRLSDKPSYLCQVRVSSMGAQKPTLSLQCSQPNTRVLQSTAGYASDTRTDSCSIQRDVSTKI